MVKQRIKATGNIATVVTSARSAKTGVNGRSSNSDPGSHKISDFFRPICQNGGNTQKSVVARCSKLVYYDNLNVEKGKCYFSKMSSFKYRRCNSGRCKLCPKANSEQISDIKTYKIFCKTFCCIYGIKCKKCEMVYIGQTKNCLNIRINLHRSQVYRLQANPTIESTLELRHFAEHGINEIEVSIIDVVNDNLQRLWWEQHHIKQLGSVFPYGLNTINYNTTYNCDYYGVLNNKTVAKSVFKYNLHRKKRGGRKRKISFDETVNNIKSFFSDNVDMGHIPHGWIKNMIFGVRIKFFQKIWYFVQQHEILFDTDLDHRNLAVMKDLIKLRANSLNIDLCRKVNKKVFKEYFVVQFRNKNYDRIPLKRIVENCTKLLPIGDFRVSVAYKYRLPVGRKIFNYNSFSCNLKKTDMDTCDCNNMTGFTEPTLKHVITGNLDVIKNAELRGIMERGTKYRFQVGKNVIETFIKDVEDFIYKMAVKYSMPIETFEEWKHFVIKGFGECYRRNMYGIYCEKLNLGEIEKIQEKYIITYVDKATSNYALTCRKLYHKSLLDCYSNVTMYQHLNMSKRSIENRIMALYKKIGIVLKHVRFPYLTLIPKLHKNPIKFRPVTIGYKTYLKEANDRLLEILKTIIPKLKNQGAHMVSNSFEAKQMLEGISDDVYYRCYDFTDLFNNINIKDLFDILMISYEKFDLQLFVTFEKYKILARMVLFETVLYNGMDFYKQSFGIPMGGSCSSMLTDVYLNHYESGIHILNEIIFIRYVDDCLTVVEEQDYTLDFGFYPSGLQLVESVPIDGEVNFLDLTIANKKSDGGCKKTIFRMYDKRSAFTFRINYLIPWTSNIDKKVFRNIIRNYLIRSKRLNTNIEDQYSCVNKYLMEAKKVGYPTGFLNGIVSNFYNIDFHTSPAGFSNYSDTVGNDDLGT